ncbi:MAG: hypothetical protein AB7T48_09535 [Solirubrobacterales bacterium]
MAEQGSPKVGETKKAGKREYIDQRLAKAIGHPMRVAIMVEMAKAPISPNEYSELAGVSLTDSAYHFRALWKNDCIKLVDEQPVRGAMEHFYELNKRALISDEEFARYRELPAPVRGGFNGWILGTFLQEYECALEADTMDAQENRHVTWQNLRLDKEGFDNLMEGLMAVFEQAGVEQLASEARLEKSGEEPIYTTLGMFGFESPRPVRKHNLSE